jgi:hypothetical protein
MPDQTKGFTPTATNDGRNTTKEAQESMKSRLLPKLNFSNAVAMIALFVALGGAAVAAGLPKNSVGTKQLKRGAVNTSDLRRAAVKGGKLAPKSVVAGKLGANAVLPGNIVNGGITSAKIGNGAVIARSIKNNVITTNKLNGKAVTTAKLADEAVTTPVLANGSVTPAKLSKEFGPLISPLKSGQTLQGSFAVGGAGKELTVAIDGQTFQFPLANAPAVNVINPSTSVNGACTGLGSGQAPAAVAGNLCLYVTNATNLKTLAVPTTSVSRFGFGLEATAEDKEKPFSAFGVWAVTAP